MTSPAEGSPRPAEVLLVLPAVLLVTMAVRFASDGWLSSATTMALLALGSAVIMGLPATFWLLELQEDRWYRFAGIGALAGALVPLCAVVSGVIGLTARQGWTYAVSVLERFAPLPLYGSMFWTRFAAIDATSAIIGAASGTVFWLVRVDRRHGFRNTLVRVVLTIVVAMADTHVVRQALAP